MKKDKENGIKIDLAINPDFSKMENRDKKAPHQANELGLQLFQDYL